MSVYVTVDNVQRELSSIPATVNNVQRELKSFLATVDSVQRELLSSGFKWARYSVIVTNGYEFNLKSNVTSTQSKDDNDKYMWLYSDCSIDKTTGTFTLHGESFCSNAYNGTSDNQEVIDEVFASGCLWTNKKLNSSYKPDSSITGITDVYKIKTGSARSTSIAWTLERYEAVYVDEKTRGSFINIAKSFDENAYPENGIQDGYWYVRLDDAYVMQQLEYIESSGTQYINTGFNPNQNTRVVMDAQYVSADNSTVLFGARHSSGTPNFTIGIISNTLRISRGSLNSSTGLDKTARYLIDLNRAVCSLNESIFTQNDETFALGIPLYLFARNNAGSADYYSKARIYSCKIYDNDVLVRNYIPFMSPDCEIGMYDLVNDVFYGNAGSGSFTGLVEGLPDGYTALSYIESSGSQYIDTGFKPNQDTGVEIDFDFLETNTGTDHHIASVNNNSQYYAFRVKSNLAGYASRYYTDALADVSTTTPYGRHMVVRNKNKTSLDGGAEVTHTYGAFQITNTLPICCFKNASGALSGYAKLKIYSCKIHDNGVLIRNFVPCKNPSGMFGMYDLVTNEFYGNAGSGAFTGG